jgi:Uma2 family endonuclease
MGVVALRRWTRDEYDKMIAAGLFAPGERVELIDGEILQMTPQGSAHFTAISLAEEALRKAFGAGFQVRSQAPLSLPGDSEPEPALAVVAGTPRDYRNAHPGTALIVMEVADNTLQHDRRRKGSLYARAGIRDFWIINLIDRCIEVYRDPGLGSYGSIRRFIAGEHLTPLSAPDARIAVADILP